MIAFALPGFNGRHGAGVSAVVRRLTPGEPDAHGNVTGVWEDRAVLLGCAFDPGSSSEPRLVGHERVIVEPTLYAAYDAPVEAHDRLVIESVTYEVEGVARRWQNPFNGRKLGCVISLRLVTG